MKKGNIEDIYIGANMGPISKKSNKGIIIVLIVLIIILACMVGAYFYFVNKSITPKESFIQSFSKTNINKFMQNDIYNEILNRISNENSESTTKVKFSTTDENDSLEGVEISDFELNLNNKTDIEKSKSFIELLLNYSGNELFKARLLATENEIAIASDEIVNRYVGIHYDKMPEILGIDVDKEKVEETTNLQKIDLTEEEKNNYLKNYMSKFLENIPDEKFSTEENITIEKNSNNVPVVSYTLSLTQDEYKSNLVSLLTQLKSDEELLGKLCKEENSSSNSSAVFIDSDSETNTTSEENTTAENNESLNAEVSNSTINIYETTNSSVDQVQESNYNSSLELDSNSLSNTESDEQNIPIEFEASTGNFDVVKADTGNTKAIISFVQIFMGYKIDGSVEDLQSQIDSLIKFINSSKGDGLKVVSYVSEKATEKINFTFPGSTLECEFTVDENNANSNQMKISYLNTENKNESEDGTITYSAEDDISDANVSQKSGFTLLLNKVENEASTNLKATLSLAEDEKINNKYDIDIKTDGTSTSNNIKNDIVIGINTDTSKYQAVIENSINFGSAPEIEDLTDENCLFVENLSEEERTQTFQAIMQKIGEVYAQKLQDMNLINTNTGTSFSTTQNTENVSNKVSKEDAKSVLIDKVAKMMGEAQNNGEEFTIKNLEGLQIEGYQVSTTVTDEAAIIVVDTHTFKIDKNFIITDE